MTYRHKNKSLSKEEWFAWKVTFSVFVVCFVFYFIYGFVTNCIFEWPIRWDIGVCWNEQIAPAKEKASEKAVIFAL